MSAERFLEAPTAEALKRLRAEGVKLYAHRGPWLEVAFPAANTRRDIRHRLGMIPTGYLIALTIGGNVTATAITDWSKDLAFLQADAANTRARLCFVVTKEPPIDA